mmetsp:Transcript_730/g.2201  ORF Transcript_730/g.2201 Transcript_730/m.2201 type:complete len:241 (-) Transcript_730:1474-2196(-)
MGGGGGKGGASSIAAKPEAQAAHWWGEVRFQEAVAGLLPPPRARRRQTVAIGNRHYGLHLKRGCPLEAALPRELVPRVAPLEDDLALGLPLEVGRHVGVLGGVDGLRSLERRGNVKGLRVQGQVARAVAILVVKQWVGPGLQQLLHHLQAALLRCPVESRHPRLVRGVKHSPVLDELLHHGHVPLHRGKAERGPVVLVHRVHVRPVLQQQRSHLAVPLLHGPVQGGPVPLVHCVDFLPRL